MPKKKPIDKRLNKLFTEINPEHAELDPKKGPREARPKPGHPVPGEEHSRSQAH